MAKTLTNLSVGMFGDASALASSFTGAIGVVAGFGSKIADVGGQLMEWVGVGAALEIGRQAIDHIGEAIKAGFETADKIEESTVALTGLAGSAANAEAIMTHLKNFATGSIIPLDDLTAATRKMLAIGISADQIEPILKNLGDIAAGTGGNVGDMAEVFTKVAAEGNVSTKVLKELGKQGIPIVDQLAKQFNTTAAGVQALAKNGQIGFADLQTAFQAMTGPGGKFAGLMDAQANTVGGTYKRLQTTLSFSFAEIAQEMESAFDMKGSLDSVMTVIPNITSAIVNGIAIIGPYVVMVRDWIWNGLGAVWELIQPPLMNAVNFIAGVLPSIPAIVGEAMDYVWGIVTDVWSSIWDFIGPIVTGISGTIGAHWDDIVESTVGLADSVVNVFEGIFTEVSGIAKLLWDDVVAVWNWAWGNTDNANNDGAANTADAFESMYDTVKEFVDDFKTFLNTCAYEMKHWQDVIQIEVDAAILAFVMVGNEVEYILTEVIPAVLTWFGNNWQDIMTDIANFSMTVFQNLGSNIVGVMKNLPGLISGATDFDDVWKPLTDGFKSELKELPQIPERQAGDYEKALTDQLGQELSDYGTGLDKYLSDQDSKTKAFSKHITGGIQKGLDNVKDPKSLKVIADKDKNPVIEPTLSSDNLDLKISPKIEAAKLLRVGSGEAGLASYAAPIIAGAIGGGGGAGGRPIAPNSPAAPQGGTATSDSPEKIMAKAIELISRYIVKWDSNPPIAAVTI